MKIKLTTNHYLLAVLAAIYLFLMHIYIPHLGGGTAIPVEYLLSILIGTIILMGIRQAVKMRNIKVSTYMPYYLLFCVLLISTSLFNPIKNMNIFLVNVFRLAAGGLLWLALLQFNLTSREKLTLLLFIFASAVIENIIGLMQFFELYKNISLIPPVPGMNGALQQRNLLASWTATALVISLHLVTTKSFRGYQTKKAFIYTGAALFTMTLIAGGSKTGMIGAAAAIAVLLGFRWRHYRLNWRYLLIWLLMLCIGIALSFALLGERQGKASATAVISQHAKMFSDTSQGSYTRRILMYKASLAMFKEKPLFGQGFSNFTSLYMYQQAEVLKAEPVYRELINDYTSHPHNEILLIIAENGLAGIIALLVLIAGAARTAFRYGRERTGLYAALLLPILFHMLTEFPVHQSTAFYLLFIMLVSLSTSHFPKNIRLELPPYMAKAIIAMATVITLVFSVYAAATFTAYKRLTAWESEKLLYGKGLEADLLPAAGNFYLRNWVWPVYMFEKTNEAIANIEKNRDIEKNLFFLQDYIRWSRLQKQRQPFDVVFFNEATVLLFLGLNLKDPSYCKEAAKTAEDGLALYPKISGLKELKGRITSECMAKK